MSKWILIFCLIHFLTVPASAMELSAPEVPPAGQALMPRESASFSLGLEELLQKALKLLHPNLTEAVRIGLCVVCMAVILSVLAPVSPLSGQAVRITGTWVIASCLFAGTRTMIPLASDTIRELTDYGLLLVPVMTASLAAQGGVTASAALYGGTTAFSSILGKLVSGVLIPLVYLFLALSMANCATGENLLKRLQDLVKGFMVWCLKILMTVFTAYMSITGVISGTTDAAALKAAKVTISTAVPLVGGILSDASEAVLVSAGLMKNAAGIYGILAALSVFLAPFVRIGCHYLILKTAAALCALFAGKETAALVDDFSAAMGLLLAMTGSVCLLILISTVCFLKGAPG